MLFRVFEMMGEGIREHLWTKYSGIGMGIDHLINNLNFSIHSPDLICDDGMYRFFVIISIIEIYMDILCCVFGMK